MLLVKFSGELMNKKETVEQLDKATDSLQRLIDRTRVKAGLQLTKQDIGEVQLQTHLGVMEDSPGVG